MNGRLNENREHLILAIIIRFGDYLPGSLDDYG